MNVSIRFATLLLSLSWDVIKTQRSTPEPIIAAYSRPSQTPSAAVPNRIPVHLRQVIFLRRPSNAAPDVLSDHFLLLLALSFLRMIQ